MPTPSMCGKNCQHLIYQERRSYGMQLLLLDAESSIALLGVAIVASVVCLFY